MQRLTETSTWAARHSHQSLGQSESHRIPRSIRQQHKLFQRVLPEGPEVRTIEIGCFPGRFLEYFYRQFGHSVTGLEYIEESCATCTEMLESRGIPAQIIHGDVFDGKWNTDQAKWDVVFSAGLIEHFDDSSPAVERHLQLVAPGGHCVITLPNHSGLNGRLLKAVDRSMWNLHNHMSAQDVQLAFEHSPSSKHFDLLCCDYIEHVGFWNCGVYEQLHAAGRPAYVLGRGICKGIEAAGQWIPNSKALSPNIVMIARSKQG